MKRGGELKRTELRRKAELRRTPFARKPAGHEPRHAAPQRSTRLRPRSARTAAVYVVRRVLVADLLAERPWCQIRWDEGCQARSTDIHEPECRSRGADICDPAACVAGCRYCHDQVHAHPAEATDRRWLIPSGRPRKAVPRKYVSNEGEKAA